MRRNRFFKRGLKYSKRYLITLTAGVVLLVAVSVVVLSTYSRVLSNSIQNKGELTASDYYLSVYQVLSKEISAVDVATENVNYMIDEGATNEELHTYLEDESQIYLEALDTSFMGLYMCAADGAYLDGMNYDVAEDYNPKKRPWYLRAVDANGEIAISEPYSDTVTGNQIFTISKLCEDGKSVVAADIDLSDIQKITQQIYSDSDYSFVAVVSKDGYINSCQAADQIGTSLAAENEAVWKGFREKVSKSGLDKSYSFEVGKTGKKECVIVRKIYGDWYGVLAAPKLVLHKRIYIMQGIFFVVFCMLLAYMVLFYRNVWRTRNSRDQFRKLSEVDLMTKILNRGAGELKMRKLLDEGTRGAFFMMDADHFKKINDTYGHATGDKVLIAVAKVLKESFRTRDIVFRLGGDEFACFVPGILSRLELNRICERLLENYAKIDIPEVAKEDMSLSIGIAIRRQGDEDFETLYHRADSAAYESKKTAGSCFTIAD